MNLHRRFRVHVYLLVFLSVLAFAVAERNPPLLVVGLVAIGFSWWLLEGSNPRPLPRWLINLGVLGSSLLLFWELVIFRQENLLVALGHFMIAVLLCKLFESRSTRDHAQVLVLTLLVAVTASISQPGAPSILFGVTQLAYMLVGVYTLLLFQLRHLTLAPAGGGEASPVVKRDLKRVARTVGLGMVLVGITVFLLFPRTRGNQLLGNWSLQRFQRTTGMADHVSFDNLTQLTLSDALVMDVRLTQAGMDAGSEYYQPYFRGMTFDSYDPSAMRWVRSRGDRSGQAPVEFRLSAGEAQLAPRTSEKGEPLYLPTAIITQQYTLYNPTHNVLFALTPPIAVRSEDVGRLNFLPRDNTLIAGRLPVEGLRYEVDSPVVARSQVYLPPASRPAGSLGHVEYEDFSGEVKVPAQVAPIARQILGELVPEDGKWTAEGAALAASRIEAYLRDNYPYSLSTRWVDRNLDPTVDFLVNRRQMGGHCEYFASSMIMLCASVGIQSRMATGYHGGEYNALDGFYRVRQRNAHAWVEVYIPGRGWAAYDPTPAGDDTGEAPSAWGRWIRNMYEVMERNWLSGVVSFDNSTRRYIADVIVARLRAIPESLLGMLGEARESLAILLFAPTTPWYMRGYAVLMAGLACVGGTMAVRRLRRRRQSAVRRMVAHLDPPTARRLAAELAFYDDLLAVLERAGVRRAAEQTPREYVEAAIALRPAIASHGRLLVAVFYDVRFGAVRMTPHLRQQVATALAAVRSELGRRG